MSNFKVITIGGASIHSGPGDDYDYIGDLGLNERVISPRTTGWLPILVEDEEGQSVAWAEAKHFKEVKTAPTAPPIVVAVVTGKAIVAKAMTQNGDPYIFGYETNLNNPNPSAFDCSELVEWDCHQLGVVPRMPDGAANQYDHCKRYGTVISVAEGVRTVGALLFRLTSDGNHVVISRGDGSTIEAKGRDYGVGVFSTAGRGFNAAALIPGVTYV